MNEIDLVVHQIDSLSSWFGFFVTLFALLFSVKFVLDAFAERRIKRSIKRDLIRMLDRKIKSSVEKKYDEKVVPQLSSLEKETDYQKIINAANLNIIYSEISKTMTLMMRYMSEMRSNYRNAIISSLWALRGANYALKVNKKIDADYIPMMIKLAGESFELAEKYEKHSLDKDTVYELLDLIKNLKHSYLNEIKDLDKTLSKLHLF